MENDISCDDGAPTDAINEAISRKRSDGIPRHVYADGRIMKWDWEMPEVEVEDHEMSIKEYIEKLIEQQNGQQG